MPLSSQGIEVILFLWTLSTHFSNGVIPKNALILVHYVWENIPITFQHTCMQVYKQLREFVQPNINTKLMTAQMKGRGVSY